MFNSRPAPRPARRDRGREPDRDQGTNVASESIGNDIGALIDALLPHSVSKARLITTTVRNVRRETNGTRKWLAGRPPRVLGSDHAAAGRNRS
jgi:hypothetical protein